MPADVKQIIFICVLFYFELGGITKHLMTGSEFCFPETLNVPRGEAEGNIEVSGKQNSLFSLGPVIKCLLFTIAAMLVFKLSCKLAMCYAGGQTLEKRKIAENRLVEILK